MDRPVTLSHHLLQLGLLDLDISDLLLSLPDILNELDFHYPVPDLFNLGAGLFSCPCREIYKPSLSEVSHRAGRW